MAEKMKIKPPYIALFYLLIAIVLDIFLSSAKLILFPYNFIGTVLIIIGVWIIIVATSLFKKNGTPKSPFKEPKVFVASGPYKFTRNPMYLGVTTVSLGIATLFGNLIVFLAPIAFFLTINFTRIPKEEKIMEKLFGQNYVDYKNKVRRWL